MISAGWWNILKSLLNRNNQRWPQTISWYTQNIEGFLITTKITLTMLLISAEEVDKRNPPSEAEWGAPQHRRGGSTQGTSYEVVPREDNSEKNTTLFGHCPIWFWHMFKNDKVAQIVCRGGGGVLNYAMPEKRFFSGMSSLTIIINHHYMMVVRSSSISTTDTLITISISTAVVSLSRILPKWLDHQFIEELEGWRDEWRKTVFWN